MTPHEQEAAIHAAAMIVLDYTNDRGGLNTRGTLETARDILAPTFVKIAALEAENDALRQRLVVDDAMVAVALREYVGADRYARDYEYCDAQLGPKMRAALEAALGEDKP
jgi:hypothetical protein